MMCCVWQLKWHRSKSVAFQIKTFDPLLYCEKKLNRIGSKNIHNHTRVPRHPLTWVCHLVRVWFIIVKTRTPPNRANKSTHTHKAYHCSCETMHRPKLSTCKQKTCTAHISTDAFYARIDWFWLLVVVACVCISLCVRHVFLLFNQMILPTIQIQFYSCDLFVYCTIVSIIHVSVYDENERLTLCIESM